MISYLKSLVRYIKNSRKPLYFISIILLTIPLSILFLTFFADCKSTTRIGDINMQLYAPLFFIAVTILIILNYLSSVFKRISSYALVLTGVFFITMGFTHGIRYLSKSDFIVLGCDVPLEVSATASITLIIYSFILFYVSLRSVREHTISFWEVVVASKQRISNTTPHSATFLGILTCVVVAAPTVTLVWLIAVHFTMDENINEIAWVGIVGAQGSVVSMIIRMRNIGKVGLHRSFEVFVDSLLRPFVGLSFAHFTYFIINAGLLGIPKGAEDNFSYAVAMAFIVGFTERIKKDIVPT